MKGSNYDTQHDGTCGAPQCKNVTLLTEPASIFTKMLPIVEADAREIGITFHVETTAGAFPTLQTTAKNIPIAIFPGWFKDYADPYTFFDPLFDGRTIIPNGNTNYSLVGLTPGQAPNLGITGNITGVPNVDSKLDACAVSSGRKRLACYENLDRYLMIDVAPWVLPVVVRRAHHGPGCDAMAVRPVQRRHRLRARRRIVKRPLSNAAALTPTRPEVTLRIVVRLR